MVVRPDRVGDVVLSTPVFHTLKQSFENPFVGALVSSRTRPLLEGNPNIDVIITDDPEGKKSRRSSFREKVAEIRSLDFDAALLLMPTERLAYMLFLAGIPYRVGVGHVLYEVITLMRGVSRRKYNPLRHESDYMLDLARRIGATNIWTKPEIFLSEAEITEGREFLLTMGLDPDRSIVCLQPGSGRSAPNWLPERYAALGYMLIGAGVQVLITGSPAEKEFEKSFDEVVSRGARLSFDLPLRPLASVIAQVDVLVSASTGPMHIAAAVGTSTVSIFCPLPACSPGLWGPVGNDSVIVYPPEDFCKRKCPGDPHRCTFGDMAEGITVETVFNTVMETLRKRETRYLKDHSDDNSASHVR